MMKKKLVPTRKSLRLPIPLVLNLVLFIVAFTAFALFSRLYQTRMEAISGEENRFVTMEWELLQELKRQTDLKLLEKDREIADLRRQYRQLIQQNASEKTLRELELRITIADSERETIIANDPAPGDETSPVASFFTGTGSSSADPVSLTTLMAARIETLTAQLRERHVYARTLQEQVLSAGMQPETIVPGEEKEWQERDRRLADYEQTLTDAKRLLAATRQRLGEILDENRDTAKKPVEQLETWILLRAIASSPAIRSEYPDLAGSMNDYLESFAKKERAAARAEAYRESLEALDHLEDVLGD